MEVSEEEVGDAGGDEAEVESYAESAIIEVTLEAELFLFLALALTSLV